MKLGTAIRHIRKEKMKMTQAEFCKLVDISQVYLSQIEGGSRNPGMEIIENIAKAAGTPLPVLFLFGIEESDVKPEKLEFYRFMRPTLEKMLDTIF